MGYFGLFLILFSSIIAARNISIPITFDNAKVLPKGVYNIRYNNISTQANSKYGPYGTVLPMGHAMNLNITYEKLVEAQKTPLERGILEGYLSKQGKSLWNITGQSTGVVNVDIQAHVPVFAWGVSHKWTTALIVPIVKIKMNIDAGFVASEDLQDITNKLVDEGKRYKAREIQEKSDRAIENKLEKNKYENLNNEEKTMIGDIRMVNKVNIRIKENYVMALTGEITLPTGKIAEINKIVDVPAGDGQFDLAVGLVTDYYYSPKLTISAKMNYIWQIADTTSIRIPSKSDSKITLDIDPQVQRDLGNIFYTSLGFSYEVFEGFKVKGQYTFQDKERDMYKGQKFNFYRYYWIGKDSEQILHSLQIGISYSTISLFRQKKFIVPLDFSFLGGVTLGGNNVIQDPSVVVEMAIYF